MWDYPEQKDFESIELTPTPCALEGLPYWFYHYQGTPPSTFRRWASGGSDTFKEYVRSEVAGYLDGMPTAMKKRFYFVHVVGEGHMVVTDMVIGI